MPLFMYFLFIIISSAVCIDNDQSFDQGRYNVNHPPSAENYNPIPVSIVYEDDSKAGKSNKEKEEHIKTEPTDVSTVSEKNESDSELDNIPERHKPRALSEHQIPVAVVYDSVPDNIQTPQVSATANNSLKRRPEQSRGQPNRSENQAKEELKNEFVQPQTSIDPINSRNQKIGSVKRQPHRVGFVNLQTNRAESNKPQPTEAKSVEYQLKKAELTNLHTERIETVKPKPRKIDTTNPVQSSVESVTQTLSSSVAKAKGDQRKRERDPVVRIIDSQNYVFAHNGNFHYSYEGADGTKAFSEGQLKTINKDAGEAVSGGFSYTDKEGNDFSLSYTADENGYRPVGAHLPTSPPIPPAIARALAYLATVTTPETVTKASVT